MAKNNLNTPKNQTRQEINRKDSMVTSSSGGRDEKPKENMKHLHYNNLWCEKCLSVYSGKKWQKDPNLLNKIRGEKELKAICPACKQSKEGVAEGIVYISGFNADQKNELLNLIKNENIKSTSQDVEDKILKMEEKKDEIIVYVSDNRFATRLGKKINSAYKGAEKDIKFSKLEDATRVYVKLP
ncbi:hypothetical protein KKC88_02220 [Patescibacteria group bacterium]|nr:hypothetical protein [Patescibacteria group bacterium]MBU1673123.1 hypothetical protein [Patescibacteria group bacterium]MBU1963801.1 hypothetical protein [Patescibacteria group bacterium]